MCRELGFFHPEAVQELPHNTMQMLYSDYIKRINTPCIMRISSFELTNRDAFLEFIRSTNFSDLLSAHDGAFMTFVAYSDSEPTARYDEHC